MNKVGKRQQAAKRNNAVLDEEISSGPESDIDDGRMTDDDDDDENNDAIINESDVDEQETAQEKKIRLAKQLIKRLETDAENNVSVDVSAALDEDLQSRIGKLKRDLANRLGDSVTIMHTHKTAHRLSVTCVTAAATTTTVFSSSKDGTIVKWDVIKNVKASTIRRGGEHGHTGAVMALAVSDDGAYLASGGQDRSVKIWRAQTCEFVHSFEGHRDTVSGLSFRRGTHQLFSCSFDRCVKVWNVDQLCYVETLFGHQDKILSVDSFLRERCLTCGARDRTLRLWKIVEESQLVFNGSNFDSIDCSCMLNEEHFVSGSNDGHVSVWHINKKKPLVTVKNAHAGWICSVACVKNSDLIATGSNDGFVRLWAFNGKNNSLSERNRVHLDGFINSLEFVSTDNDANTNTNTMLLMAGVGQEHKLGRWSVDKKTRNSVVFIKLEFTEVVK